MYKIHVALNSSGAKQLERLEEPTRIFVPDNLAYELRRACETSRALVDVVHGEHDPQLA
jgi:hypothetical protein